MTEIYKRPEGTRLVKEAVNRVMYNMVDIKECFVFERHKIIAFNTGEKYALSCASGEGLYPHIPKLYRMLKVLKVRNYIEEEAIMLYSMFGVGVLDFNVAVLKGVVRRIVEEKSKEAIIERELDI
jgi:hypothetical protein